MTTPIYIFHHLRKTGGTTFNNHLYNHLDVDEEVVHFGFAGESWREKRGKLDWEKRNDEARQRARILIGHNVYWGIHRLVPDREPRYFTIIREPASQLVSMYNYHFTKKRITEPFEKWILKAPLMTKELKKQMHGENISIDEFLSRCWFVGTTSTLDQDISLISQYLGIPVEGWSNVRVAGSKEQWVLDEHVEPAIEKHLEVTDSVRELIRGLYPEEFVLWESAQKMRDKLYQKLRA